MGSHFWKEYFTFNRTERRGIRFLLVLIALQLAGILLLPYLVRNKSPDYSRFDEQVKQFLASADSIDEEKEKYFNDRRFSRSYKNAKAHLEPFDPNGLPAEKWVAMGLSQKQADVIKRYEAKGGAFYRKEDLKKLFVITESFFDRIEPYIRIEERAGKNPEPENQLRPEEPAHIDINTASAADLLQVKGIGEKLSQRIVAYRERLGGFYSVEQLREVYGLQKESYDRISSQVQVSGSDPVRKIDLNYGDLKELGSHPYIGYEKARIIIDHRNRHGFFRKTEEIRDAGLVDNALYLKLVHYIMVK